MASPTKQFLASSRRRQHQLRKSDDHDPHPIEIHVSPKKSCPIYAQVNERLRAALDPTPSNYITIHCSDGEIKVPKEIGFRCGLIRQTFEGSGNYREKVELTIRLPQFDRRTIEKVMCYCFEDYILNQGRVFENVRKSLFGSPSDNEDCVSTPPSERSQWSDCSSSWDSNGIASPHSPARTMSSDYSNSALFASGSSSLPATSGVQRKATSNRVVFGVELKPHEVMQVMMASHYLDLPDLLDISCSMIAHHYEEVETFEHIPPDALMLIFSHLSPEHLMEVEQLGNHSIDTALLWRRAAEKKGWEATGTAIVCAWEPDLARIAGLRRTEVSYPRFGLHSSGHASTAALPINWRQIYAQRELQRKLDSFAGLQESLDSISNLLRLCSGLITELTVRPGFVELSKLDVLHFLPQLTELERLDLSDNTISDQTMQNLVRLMEQGHLSALKTLKLQRTGISDSALAMLLSYQCEMWSQKKQQELHIRGCILEELDVSDNGLRNASLLKLAAALKAGVGLKKVSMRECHLASYFRYAFEDSWGPEMHGSADTTDTDPVGPLFASLRDNSSLSVLDLSHNQLNFCHVGAETWSQLRKNNSLTALLLNDNELIRNSVASEQFELFMTHLPQSLTYLNLGHCKVEPEHLPIITASLKSNSVEHLVLADNILGMDSGVLLSNLISQLTKLQSLDISSNNLLDKGGRDLIPGIRLNRTLRRLDLQRNNIGRACLEIAQSLHQTLAATNSDNQPTALQQLLMNDNKVSGADCDTICSLFNEHPCVEI